MITGTLLFVNTSWVWVSRSCECSKASIVRTVLRYIDFSANVTLSGHSDGTSPTCWPLTLSEVLFELVSVGNLQFSTDVNDMDAYWFILLNMRIANRLRYLSWLSRSCVAWNGDHRIVVDDRDTLLVLRINGEILFLIGRLSKFFNNHWMFTMYETHERPVEVLIGLLHHVIDHRDLFLFWSPADVLDLCQSWTNSIRPGCLMIRAGTHQSSHGATHQNERVEQLFPSMTNFVSSIIYLTRFILGKIDEKEEKQMVATHSSWEVNKLRFQYQNPLSGIKRNTSVQQDKKIIDPLFNGSLANGSRAYAVSTCEQDSPSTG